jgi:hypothetical protein
MERHLISMKSSVWVAANGVDITPLMVVVSECQYENPWFPYERFEPLAISKQQTAVSNKGFMTAHSTDWKTPSINRFYPASSITAQASQTIADYMHRHTY